MEKNVRIVRYLKNNHLLEWALEIEGPQSRKISRIWCDQGREIVDRVCGDLEHSFYLLLR